MADKAANAVPETGWGMVLPEFFTDEIKIENHAVNGRSTKSFINEGRWKTVIDKVKKGDWVLIQFGHNDATLERPLRYVTPEAYKEYIRLFVSQSREKGAIPIVVTPVSRNELWTDGKLEAQHGEYYKSAVEVSQELKVKMIDLTKRSMDFFEGKGKSYVTTHYFMNMSPGQYPNYPEGKTDNTHFVTEGAQAVAKLVMEGMLELKK